MNAALSRRSIMLGLAAAATAASVATVATPTPAESPALLALAECLACNAESLSGRRRSGCQHHRAMVASLAKAIA